MEIKKNGWPQYSSVCINKILKEIESGTTFDYGVHEDIKKLEDIVASKYNSKYSLTYNSGTNALHAIISALELGKNDRVLLPSFAYPASITPFTYNSCEIKLYNVDWKGVVNLKKLENIFKQNKYNAILVTHLWGQVNQNYKIATLAKKYSVKLIEDCSHAHDTLCDNNKRVGTLGVASFFSIAAYKHVSGGHGGFALTNKKKLFDAMVKESHTFFAIKDNCKKLQKLKLGTAGFNSRCHKLSAILAYDHFKNMDKISEKKRTNIIPLYKKLQKLKQFECCKVEPLNHTLYTLPFKIKNAHLAKKIQKEFKKVIIRPSIKNISINNYLNISSEPKLNCFHPSQGYSDTKELMEFRSFINEL